MCVVGLIGGQFPDVTTSYQRAIVEHARLRAANTAIPSVKCERLSWPGVRGPYGADEARVVTKYVGEAAVRLAAAGCEPIALCADVPPLMLGEVRACGGVRLMSAAEVVRRAVLEAGCKRVILLGNDAQMRLSLLKLLLVKSGVMVLTPGERDRRWLDQLIEGELSQGEVRNETVDRFVAMVNDGAEHGVDALVLGRSTLSVLTSRADVALPSFDAEHLLAEALLDALTMP